MKSLTKKNFIIISYLILVLYWIELDFLTPAFIKLTEYFSIEYSKIEQLISMDLLFRCISITIIGPISDHIPRKKFIIFGSLIVVIGTFLCCVTNSYSLFYIGKILQGVGCSISTLMYCIITENNDTEKSFSIISVTHFLLLISMVISPIIGSNFVVYFGWRSSFLLCFCISIFALITSYKIPNIDSTPKFENASIKNQFLKFSNFFSCKTIINNYKIIFQNFAVIKYVYIYSLLIAFFIAWGIIGPYFLNTELKIPLKNVGYFQSIPILSSAITNLCLGKFFASNDVLKTFKTGMIITTISSIFIMIYLFLFGHDAFIIISLITIYACGSSCITSSSITYFYKYFNINKGTAAAVDVIIQNLLAAFAIYLTTILNFTTQINLIILLFIVTLISNLLLLCHKKLIRNEI